MQIDQLKWWKFTAEPTEWCDLRCPTCGEFSVHTSWRESHIECDTCGEHITLQCPKCDNHIDMIHQFDPIEVRIF